MKRYKALKNLGITLSLLMSSVPAPIYAQAASDNNQAEEDEQSTEYPWWNFGSNIWSGLWSFSDDLNFGEASNDENYDPTSISISTTLGSTGRRGTRNYGALYSDFGTAPTPASDSSVKGYATDFGMESIMCVSRQMFPGAEVGELGDLIDYFTETRCREVIQSELTANPVNKDGISGPIRFCHHLSNIYGTPDGAACLPNTITNDDLASYRSKMTTPEMNAIHIEKQRKKIIEDAKKLHRLSEVQMLFYSDMSTLAVMKNAARNGDSGGINLDGVDTSENFSFSDVSLNAFKCTPQALFPTREDQDDRPSGKSRFDDAVDSACSGKIGAGLTAQARAQVACEDFVPSVEGETCDSSSSSVYNSVDSSGDLSEVSEPSINSRLLDDKTDLHNSYVTMMVGVIDKFSNFENARGPASERIHEAGHLSDNKIAGTSLMAQNRMVRYSEMLGCDIEGENGHVFTDNRITRGVDPRFGRGDHRGNWEEARQTSAVETTMGAIRYYIEHDSDLSLSKERQHEIVAAFETQYLKSIGRSSDWTMSIPEDQKLADVIENITNEWSEQRRADDTEAIDPNDVINASERIALMATAGFDAARRSLDSTKELSDTCSSIKGGLDANEFHNDDGSVKTDELAEAFMKNIEQSAQYDGVKKYMNEFNEDLDYDEEFKRKLIAAINQTIREGGEVAQWFSKDNFKPSAISQLFKKLLIQEVQGECDQLLNQEEIEKRYCPSESDPETAAQILAGLFDGDINDLSPGEREDRLKSATLACAPILVADEMELARLQSKGLDADVLAANVQAQGQRACQRVSRLGPLQELSSQPSFLESFFGGESCNTSGIVEDYMGQHNLVTKEDLDQGATRLTGGEASSLDDMEAAPTISTVRTTSYKNLSRTSRDGRDHSVELGGITGMEVEEFSTVQEGGTTNYGRDAETGEVGSAFSNAATSINSIFGTDKAVNPTSNSVVSRSNSIQSGDSDTQSAAQALEDELKSNGQIDSKTADLLSQLKAMEERQAALQDQLNQVMNDKSSSVSSEVDTEKAQLMAELEALKNKIPELEEQIRNGKVEDKGESRVASTSSSSRRSSSPSASPTPSSASRNIASLPTSGVAAAVSSGGSSGGSGGSSISPSANPDGFYAGSGVVSSDGSSAPGFTQNTVFTLTKSIRDRAAIVSSGVSIDDAILENNGAILIPNGNGEYMYVEPEFTADGEVKTLDGRVVYKEVLRVTDPEAIAQAGSDDSGRMPASVEEVDSSRRTYRLQELESALEDAQDSAAVQ